MPNLDRTGPQGQGAMTGGKRGRCGNNQITQSTQTTENENQSAENREIVTGLGRGGRARGGRRFGQGLGQASEGSTSTEISRGKGKSIGSRNGQGLGSGNGRGKGRHGGFGWQQ